ncbi:MAG TPA: dTMP kinase [Candidatus Saccharimonadales bacterium]|nr:dTMP kinase [Candidatus Saccharimonadales bacterium]
MAQENHGCVIMLDGPDGVGKSTQVSRLHEALSSRGYTVHVTRSHGGTPIGEALREVSLSKKNRPALTDFYISLAIHAALAEELDAQREAGVISIVDRSPLSIWAYQVYGSGLGKKIAERLLKSDLALFRPELMVVYTATLDVLKSRRPELHTGNSDYFENQPEAYFQRTIEGYADAAQRFGATLIDASASKEEVQQATWAAVENILPKLQD